MFTFFPTERRLEVASSLPSLEYDVRFTTLPTVGHETGHQVSLSVCIMSSLGVMYGTPRVRSS